MSKLKAYLEAVRNGIKNGDKVIEALIVNAKVKNGIISDEALAEILYRKAKCAACIYNSENKKKAGHAVELDYQHCTLCKCTIGGEGTKEYCLTCNCGMVEWNKRNPHLKQMLPEWLAFTPSKTVNNE